MAYRSTSSLALRHHSITPPPNPALQNPVQLEPISIFTSKSPSNPQIRLDSHLKSRRLRRWELVSKDSTSQNMRKFSTSFVPANDFELNRHREILSEIVQIPAIGYYLPMNIKLMLKSLTHIQDKLTFVIQSLPDTSEIVPERNSENFLQSLQKDNGLLKEKVHQLQSSLGKLNKDKQTLSREIINMRRETGLSKEFNDFMHTLNSTYSKKEAPNTATHSLPKLPIKRSFIDLLTYAYNKTDYRSLKGLCTESKRYFGADYVIYFRLNPQKTLFKSTCEHYQIPYNSSILSLALIERRLIAARQGEVEFDHRFEQRLSISVKSYFAAPVMTESDQPHGILLAISKQQDPPVYRDEVIKVFSLCIAKWEAIKLAKERMETIIAFMNSCETLASLGSLADFSEHLEGYLCNFAHTKRANVLVCDLLNKKLVRKTKGKMERFSLQRGLAGWTASTRQPVISNTIVQDKRFVQEIDDPDGKDTVSILSVPIISREDVNAELPKAVVQVIDKRDGSFFTESDSELLLNYGHLLIRIFESVRIQENFYCLQRILKNVELAISELLMNLDTGVELDVDIKEKLAKMASIFEGDLV